MDRIQHLLSDKGILCEEDCLLSCKSSFRIGGPAGLACFPKCREELIELLSLLTAEHADFLVIGKGSNVVFDDRGYHGAVIFTEGCRALRIEGERLLADAGAPLYALAAAARDASLAGLEFAAGIPGTLGGAVLMNAGAFGGCMADVCLSSSYFDRETNRIGVFCGAEQNFSNRTSIYEKEARYTVLGAELVLAPEAPEAIAARMSEFAARRAASQPLELPSAGSVFRRPVGHFAGKLIEDCGLKGTRIGGAEVSQKHAGFIVNRGGATAADVRALTALIRDRVLAETGVELTCEIRFLEY